jgi:hypothetical protein
VEGSFLEPGSRGPSAPTAAGDTVTLALQGDTVTLEQYAAGVERFAQLVDALAREAGASVRWEIEDLEVGSAITTARAVSTNGTPSADIERVTHAFLSVGIALERHEPIPFSPEVQQAAEEVADVLRLGVDAIRFETAEAEAVVTSAEPQVPPPVISRQSFRPAYGAVRGRVQTLSNRNTLRFTLYDLLTDRAVSCYVAKEQEELLRDIWGRQAEVEGVVSRDPLTGRPLSVRQVRDIRPLPEAEPQAWRRSRGAVPRRKGEPRAEDRIRRLRDAE